MHGRFLDISDVPRGSRVLLAMSGGVDSAVSAVLLSEAGLGVVGVTMKNYCYGDGDVPDRSCCSHEAYADARRVCDRVGIEHMVVNTEATFGVEVYDNFLTEYREGRTPNPCVRCNSIVRFSTLAEHAASVGADYVATGHYARVFEAGSGVRYLARPTYLAKDQSYFLSGMPRTSVANSLFPLGGHTKPEVREVARRAGLDVAEKPESQEVCFIPDGSLREFLDGKVPLAHGNIETPDGRVVGEHAGLASYTIGQRRGLGVAAPEPLYVQKLDRERNVLVVGSDADLFANELTCRITWLDSDVVRSGTGVSAQIRSRHSAQALSAVEVNADLARVTFEEPQRAIAPGQTIAFYDADVVVGSGVIVSSGDA